MTRRGVVATLGAVAAVSLALVAATGRTTSSFSGETANVSTFSAAASFPTACDPYAPTWMTGMEHGVDTTEGNGLWSPGISAGPGSVDATVVRSGAKSLRLTPAGAPTYRGRLYDGAGVPVSVMTFGLRLDSLPPTDLQELAGFATTAFAGSSYASVRYDADTQRLAIGFVGETILATTPVAEDTWYTIDVRVDVSGATHQIDWSIDGVAQPSTTRAGAATTVYAAGWGTSTASSFVANYDDMALSATAADYPIGRARILPMRPNSTGTGSTANNFANDDGTAVDDLSWARLADVVIGDGATTIVQKVASATSYIEMNMQDTTEACVRSAHAVMAYDPLDVPQANHGRTVVVSGGTTSVVYDGTMQVHHSTLVVPKAAPIVPDGGAWTPTLLNDVVFRFGYSTDVNPQPTWHSLLVEYDAG